MAHGVAAALVELALAEPDHFLAMNALDPLAHLRDPVQLVGSPLPGLMRHRKWQPRHAALRAAHLCPVDEVQPALLEAAEDKDAIARALGAVQLGRCGGVAATQVLIRLLAASDSDVRGTALSSLVECDAEQALPYVREAAATWPGPVRYTATALLTEHGDERDVPLVAERVRKLIGRTRSMETIPSELQHLLPFLAVHRPAPAVETAFAYVTRRWSALFEGEQRWIGERFPELVPDGVAPPPAPRRRATRTPRCPTDLDALLTTRPAADKRWRRRGRG